MIVLACSFLFPLLSVVQSDEKPSFRILAPQFVCPKDEEALIDKPDETVVMLQTSAGVNLTTEWVVRWAPLVAPSQRFTLMLWRTVRALQTQLNAPQPVPLVYVIQNEDLLKGVDYVFTLTGTSAAGVRGDPKSFHIDNTQGDNKLEDVEGRTDMFSINMLGSQLAYADINYVLEASVTTCSPTEDYYFRWSVKTLDGSHEVDVSVEMGSRLVVPPMSLKPELTYEAECQVIRDSSDEFITQTGLPFAVARRGIQLYLSADHLVVSASNPFKIEAAFQIYNFNDNEISFEWYCKQDDDPCDFFESRNVDVLLFESGIKIPGRYLIGVTVSLDDETGSAEMVVEIIEGNLPVIEITPVPRIVNEGSTTSLVANASNVAPACSLTWYFRPDDETDDTSDCTEEICMHGNPISDTLTIYSLEETFLNELSDYSNETAWREVSVEVPSRSGRARFVASCNCTLAVGCEYEGAVYSEVNFKTNKAPVPENVMISPETGVALESLHRISTLAGVDQDTPLRYSFYCGVGHENPLLLSFYYEHLSMETILPYVEGGTEVFAEVCDARGACVKSTSTLVSLGRGDGKTVTAHVDSIRGLMRRCEIMILQRVTVMAIVNYINANLQDVLASFSESLKEILSGKDAEFCRNKNAQAYDDFLNNLAGVGFEVS